MTKTIVLYDGFCGLCTRSVRWLKRLDWLQKLDYIDFRNTEARTAVAPNLQFADLDKAMHIKKPNGSFNKGFYAFRDIAKLLPLLMLGWPLLYIPGVPFVGTRLYSRIADNRLRCDGDNCVHKNYKKV